MFVLVVLLTPWVFCVAAGDARCRTSGGHKPLDLTREDADIGILLQDYRSRSAISSSHEANVATVEAFAEVNGAPSNGDLRSASADHDTHPVQGLTNVEHAQDGGRSIGLAELIEQADHTMLLQQLEVAPLRKERKALPVASPLVKHAIGLLDFAGNASFSKANHTMLLQQLEVVPVRKERKASPVASALAKHANELLELPGNASFHQVLDQMDRAIERRLQASMRLQLSLLSFSTAVSKGSVYGIDPIFFVLLGFLVLICAMVAFGCLMYVQGTGKTGGKNMGAERSVVHGSSRHATEHQGLIKLESSRGIDYQARRGGSHNVSARGSSPPLQGRNQPVGWVAKDSHQHQPATSLSSPPSLGAGVLGQTMRTESSDGVTLSMKWDIHPFRQDKDVEITSFQDHGDDEVIMCALLHEHGESCGVLLESFQGSPIAFLQTSNAVNMQGQPAPPQGRKVTVFAASSVSGISDMPVMTVFREPGNDNQTGQPRIIARRVAPLEAKEHDGAAVFEVIMDARGEPTKVVHTDGCVVAEVAPQTGNGFIILHVTFREDMWLGLAGIISARKLA